MRFAVPKVALGAALSIILCMLLLLIVGSFNLEPHDCAFFAGSAPHRIALWIDLIVFTSPWMAFSALATRSLAFSKLRNQWTTRCASVLGISMNLATAAGYAREVYELHRGYL